jgi:aminoglycoside phosphotransferase (APT) family kinase protein
VRKRSLGRCAASTSRRRSCRRASGSPTCSRATRGSSASGAPLPAAYTRTVAIAARIDTVLPRAGARPCHNDLLTGNLIRAQDDGRILIVDWEFAGMGDPRFDLGNLSVNNSFDEVTDDRLLSAYYGAPPSDSARAALKLMRVMSDAREAA